MNIVHLNLVLPREKTFKELEILDGRAWTIHFLFFFVVFGGFFRLLFFTPKSVAQSLTSASDISEKCTDSTTNVVYKLSLLERAKTLRPRRNESSTFFFNSFYSVQVNSQPGFLPIGPAEVYKSENMPSSR